MIEQDNRTAKLYFSEGRLKDIALHKVMLTGVMYMEALKSAIDTTSQIGYIDREFLRSFWLDYGEYDTKMKLAGLKTFRE